MDNHETMKLLLTRKAHGYWVTVEKVEEDLHSAAIHAMERKENGTNQH